MTNSFKNLVNLAIIVTIFIFITLGCKDSDNTNSNINTGNNVNDTKVIGGPVFSANEVCSYARGSFSEKYGSLVKKWEEDFESQDPNATYFCEPAVKPIEIRDYFLKDIIIKVDYNAWGNNPQGAYIIKLGWTAESDTNVPTDIEQSLRKELFIPYCKDITKKALKTSLPKNIVKKLQTPNLPDRSAEIEKKLFCEKVGQGFVCVKSERTNKLYNYIDFKIFASEEAYQISINDEF